MDINTNTFNISGAIDASYTSFNTNMTDKAEAQQMYLEAATWLIVDDHDAIEDTSEDWKIQPMGVVDPALQDEWKQARLWMMDPMDGALGDDAMPALCCSCNGVFWGDEMIPVAKTILRLRDKHNRSVVGIMGNIWEETERNVLKKLRANRICKKCQIVSIETRANPWQESSYNIAGQQNLRFNNIGGMSPSSVGGASGSFSSSVGGAMGSFSSSVVIPTLTDSGITSSFMDWNLTNQDFTNAVSKTFINSNDDDI